MSMQNGEPNISAENISKLTELYISYSKMLPERISAKQSSITFILFLPA